MPYEGFEIIYFSQIDTLLQGCSLFALTISHACVWVTHAQPSLFFYDNNHVISFISLNIDNTEFISVVLLYILDPKQMFIQGFPNY